MTWEVFERIRYNKKRGATVTVYQSGKLAFTQEARDLIDTEFVRVAYNKSLNAIGLIPEKHWSKNAYRFQKQKRSQMHLLNLYLFIKWNQLDILGRTFDVVLENEMVVIRLEVKDE